MDCQLYTVWWWESEEGKRCGERQSTGNGEVKKKKGRVVARTFVAKSKQAACEVVSCLPSHQPPAGSALAAELTPGPFQIPFVIEGRRKTTLAKFVAAYGGRHSLSKTCTTNTLMIHGALRDGRRRAANAPSTRFSFLCSRPTAWPCRAFATSPAQGAKSRTSGNINAIRLPKTNKIKSSTKKAPDGPTADQRLELCLPPHLRNGANEVAGNEAPFVSNAPETAKLALEAFSAGRGFITYLAIGQGRWRAAVWLVKLLVEHFHMPFARSDRLSHTIQNWNRTGTLDDATDNPLYLVPASGEPLPPHIRASSSTASLHELTDDKPESLSRTEVLRHKILGLVWRDIGRLILACSTNQGIAGGEVKQEILEMIALLHHYELMPASIYAYVPAQSEDAIQQPPTLHILSQRIFTALSDATWRAREISALEESKRKGGELMGLEAKGSSYRVRVSGVKPEIWLELILWSCLHGGWISDGADLLHSVTTHRKWTPMSWRDSLNAVMPIGQEDLLDWDSIKYMFDTRSNATMDANDISGLRVDKTVSSEVVNAYIDALLDTISVGVGDRGVGLRIVMRHVRNFQRFLQRANLNLGGGTWDAMMLRLVESGSINVDRDPTIMQRLVLLSPQIGEELQSRRSQAIPSYVLDGSAATLGLLHRALYAEIRNDNLEGALKVFELLQERVDKDRHQSLSDFFAHKHLSPTGSGDSSKGPFTSNFSGIDYPSFSTQIPPATLAAFLELVIANKSFAFGNWMLGIDNTDIDGPLIPVSLYPNPHISAAIVHYATITNNTALLSKITQLGAVQIEEGGTRAPALPKELLQAFLDAQIDLRRWDAARKILEHMHDTDDFDWSVGNAATLAKVMVVESKDSTFAKQQTDVSRAYRLFASLLAGEYGVVQRPSRKHESINTLCVVLASVSPLLAATVQKHNALPKHFNFTLRAGAFNSVLEGVVATHGSEAGRALVDRFLLPERPKQTRSTESSEATVVQDEQTDHDDFDDTHNTQDITPSPRMPRFMQDALKADSLARTKLSIACASQDAAFHDNYRAEVAMYGSFRNIGPTTVRIIVRQALSERANRKSTPQQQSDTQSLDLFAWALVTLRRAGIKQSAVFDELNGAENGLTGNEMRTVERLATEMWERNVATRRRVTRDREEEQSDADVALPDLVPDTDLNLDLDHSPKV
jgi:hypothetical protein